MLEQLEDYLRIGLSNIPNARRERNRRKVVFSQLLQKARGQLTRLPSLVEEEILYTGARDDPQTLRVLQGFLATLLPPATPEEAPPTVQPQPPEPVPQAAPAEGPEGAPSPAAIWIGRVAPTQNEPADADGFPFWNQPGEDQAVSLGDIVTAEDSERRIRVVGVVQQLRAFTTLGKMSDHFLAHDLGQAAAKLPTEIPTIVGDRAGILWRLDGRAAPPERDRRLRRASPEEIRRALAGQITPAYAVPAGFIQAPGEHKQMVWVPVDMDLRWLAGYESGHINIAGISGVAAKTSYGLFLVGCHYGFTG